MIKVGIYGVENTHAKAFCEAFRSDPALSDFQVAYVGGIYPESVAALAEAYGAKIENDPEKMAKNVDCAMITCRDGKYHLAAALPFVRRGLPIFLDKPLTVTEEECEVFVRVCRENGVKFIGGSSVKLAPAVEKILGDKEGKKILAGNVTCPISLKNEYGGFFFYASHLAETLLRTFGYDPETVEARYMPGGVCGTVYYRDFPVRFTYLDGVYDYAIEVDTSDGILFEHIDISEIQKAEAEAFGRLVKQGEADFSVYELTKAVYLVAAMDRALASGKTETVGSLPEDLL